MWAIILSFPSGSFRGTIRPPVPCGPRCPPSPFMATRTSTIRASSRVQQRVGLWVAVHFSSSGFFGCVEFPCAATAVDSFPSLLSFFPRGRRFFPFITVRSPYRPGSCGAGSCRGGGTGSLPERCRCCRCWRSGFRRGGIFLTALGRAGGPLGRVFPSSSVCPPRTRRPLLSFRGPLLRDFLPMLTPPVRSSIQARLPLSPCIPGWRAI